MTTKNSKSTKQAASPPLPARTGSGLPSVLAERKRQDAKWGEQNHPPGTWLVILMEEVGEASEATLEMDWNSYRDEMVQVAAVALAAVESCDRSLGIPPNALGQARRGTGAGTNRTRNPASPAPRC